jgi:hypothetical protein
MDTSSESDSFVISWNEDVDCSEVGRHKTDRESVIENAVPTQKTDSLKWNQTLSSENI